MWPFKKQIPPEPPIDGRVWNEDWHVGDVAECIVDGNETVWSETVKPWNQPKLGQRLIVKGFSEGADKRGILFYFLLFEDWPVGLSTQAFRKVRPQAKSVEQSEVVERILKAKPGKDKVRETTE